MRLLTRSHQGAVLVLAGLIVAAYAGSALWRASRAFKRAARQVREAADLPVASLQLGREPPRDIDWFSSPAVFDDAVEFQENLFLAGPTGLFEVDPQGRLIAQYRAGMELPPSRAVALAVGMARGQTEDELFIATSGAGLLAFDGRTFRQILPQKESLRHLTAILPIADGRLLLGTAADGVLAFSGRNLTFFHPKLERLSVTALAGDDTSLWVGTRNRGVLHWHGGDIDAFNESNGLPDPEVLSLTVSGDSAFVGTPLGVAQFVNGRFTRVLAKGFIARSLIVRDGKLEVGTVDEGCLEIPLTAEPARTDQPMIRELPSEVRSFFEADSALYAVGENGLYSLDAQTGEWRERFGQQASLLSDRNVSALAFDAQGRLWVGYFDRGLDILDSSLQRFKHVENDRVFCVNRIVEDAARDSTLVATANGLMVFDATGIERQALTRADGLISSHVTDVALSHDGVTVATPAGVTLISPSGTRSLYAFQGLVSNHVYALGSSGDRLLAGTLGGLSVLHDGAVVANYTSANSGLKQNWITAIAPVGNVWFIGTANAGIVRFTDSGTWEEFPDLPGNFEVNPNAMAVAGGQVYAGTRGRGLLVYDRSRASWTAVTTGLPSLNVTAIAVDAGGVYVGTDNGLVRLPAEYLSSL